MEYNGGYLDDEELSHLDQEQGNGNVEEQKYEEQPPAPQDLGGQHSNPVVEEEELLAAQAAADAAVEQQQQQGQPGGVFNNVGQGLMGKDRDMMMQYWQETINSIEHDEHDFKNHQLPLARIKKVMKTDEEVRMISAEAPILFAKGCDVFVTELTMRAWIHAEENKRRTLQKSDIAAALTKSDMFDFLIDVVPREEEKPKKSFPTQSRTGSYLNTSGQQHHILHQPGMHALPLRGPGGLPTGPVQTPLGLQLPATQGLPMVPPIPQNALAAIPQEGVAVKNEKKDGDGPEGYGFESYPGYSSNY